MTRPVRILLLLPILLGLVATTACSGEDQAEATTTDDVQALDADFVPETILGLAVDPEDTEGLEDVNRSYVEAIRLYSLRDGEQLVATLQISRFSPGVKWAQKKFQRGVLNQVGANAPDPVRVGDRTVYLTTGVKQRVAVWFDGGYLFLLGIRDEFDRPRSLLREAMEVSP